MDNGEYILGILVIIAIYIYYIGDVVWGFNISDRLCKKEKETEHKIKARRKSDMVMLQSVEFADNINVAELYDNLCKGGIQGIKSIKKVGDRYWVEMEFCGKGYFTLTAGRVNIVSIGNIINMKNGKLLRSPQQDSLKYTKNMQV